MGDDLRMKHMFVSEAIWIVKQIEDQDAQITELANTFRDRAFIWYMKFQSTMPVGHTKILDEIKTTLIV